MDAYSFDGVSMNLPDSVIGARQNMKEHLDRFSWSGLSERKKSILQAFLNIATAEGYSAVTMRSLAKDLNIKAPSIYSHFPEGKDDIVCECLRWHYYGFGIAILDAVKDAKSSKDFFDSMVKVHFTRQITHPESALWDLLILSDRIGQFLRADIRQEMQHWIALCIKLYQAVIKENGFRSDETTVRVLMNLLDGSSTWCTWDGTNRHLEELNNYTLEKAYSCLA